MPFIAHDTEKDSIWGVSDVVSSELLKLVVLNDCLAISNRIRHSILLLIISECSHLSIYLLIDVNNLLASVCVCARVCVGPLF